MGGREKGREGEGGREKRREGEGGREEGEKEREERNNVYMNIP